MASPNFSNYLPTQYTQENQISNDLYLITGATGKTGSNAIQELLSQGARVRAFVHRDDERAAALRAKGVQVVFGELLDSHAVRDALRG